MAKKHECCIHIIQSPIDHFGGPYCCRCAFGVKRSEGMHGDGFYCANCNETHPGSKFLDGCPNWFDNFNNAIAASMTDSK